MTDLCFVADLGSQNPVDFGKLSAASYDGVKCAGVIHRATRSNGLVDGAYGTRLPQIIAAGLLPGAYAFNTGETAAVQAARFIKVTSPDIPGLFRALDFEPNPSGTQMTLAMAIEFIDRVDQTFGRATALYSGSLIKQLIVNATDAQRDFLAIHPSWIPEYGPECRMADIDGKPLPWKEPSLWQFTGDGLGNQPHTLDGLQAGADLSIFKGTRAELAKVWAGLPVTAAPAIAPAAPIATAPPPSQPAIVALNQDGWWARVKRSVGI